MTFEWIVLEEHLVGFCMSSSRMEQGAHREPCCLACRSQYILSRYTACVQGVIEEIRDDTVIRSIRSDSDNTVVGEIAFFMGIAQPRQFLVCSDYAVLHCT